MTCISALQKNFEEEEKEETEAAPEVVASTALRPAARRHVTAASTPHRRVTAAVQRDVYLGRYLHFLHGLTSWKRSTRYTFGSGSSNIMWCAVGTTQKPFLYLQCQSKNPRSK